MIRETAKAAIERHYKQVIAKEVRMQMEAVQATLIPSAAGTEQRE